MRRWLVTAAMVAALGMLAPGASAAEGDAGTGTDKALCLKACLDQNPGLKGACAIQCGLLDGDVVQPRRDCGVDYKTCMQACDKDDTGCRDACRTARRSCI